MSTVVPAVLPSSHQDFEEKLALFARISSVDRVQIDVVDGRFAKPACWPFSAKGELETMVQKGEMLPHLDRIAYEVDLMCFDAEDAAEAWLALGATRLTFHAESDTNPGRLLETSRKRYDGGLASDLLRFGLALNIESDLSLIEKCLDEVSYVQFMGIAHIGKQGQPFDTRVLNKIRVFHKRHPNIPIQVDGGVSLANAKELLSLGVSRFVVGSGILRAKDPSAEVVAFETLQSPYGV